MIRQDVAIKLICIHLCNLTSNNGPTCIQKLMSDHNGQLKTCGSSCAIGEKMPEGSNPVPYCNKMKKNIARRWEVTASNDYESMLFNAGSSANCKTKPYDFRALFNVNVWLEKLAFKKQETNTTQMNRLRAQAQTRGWHTTHCAGEHAVQAAVRHAGEGGCTKQHRDGFVKKRPWL